MKRSSFSLLLLEGISGSLGISHDRLSHKTIGWNPHGNNPRTKSNPL